jgi:hypothetical protein
MYICMILEKLRKKVKKIIKLLKQFRFPGIMNTDMKLKILSCQTIILNRNQKGRKTQSSRLFEKYL